MATNTSIRGARIGAAEFYFGDAYTGDTYAAPGGLVDVGLTSGGVRITLEPDPVYFKSEQLRGYYGAAYQNKIVRIQVGGLDQNTIWNIADAWAYSNSDVVSSSVLILDDSDLTERSVKITANTTKITSGNQAGTRNWEFGRVAQVGNVEVNHTVEDITRLPIELVAFVDKSGKFGELTQTVQETAPA